MTPRPRSLVHLHGEVTAWLEGRVRRLGLLGGAAWILAGLVLAWLGGGPVRSGGSPWALAVDGLLLAGVAAGSVVLGRLRGRTVNERTVSRAMEESGGLPDGVVQGVLELERGVPAGVSRSLALRSHGVLAGRLDGDPRTLGGSPGRRVAVLHRRAARTAVALAAVVAGLGLVQPERLARGAAALASPVATLNGPALPPLEVSPGHLEVPRGSPVTVTVAAPLRQTVRLRWQAAGEVARELELGVSRGTAGHTFPEVGARVSYTVEAPDGATAGPFELVPVDPLFVGDLVVGLTFPAYLDRPGEEYRAEVPLLVLPEGTRVAVRGQASRPLDRAAVTLAEDPLAALTVEGAAFRGSFVPVRDGRYGWEFTDVDGEGAALTPDPLSVSLVADSAPSVDIVLPSPDTLLPTNLRQPLVLDARDDYGLRELELVAWRVTALGDTLPAVSQRVEMGGAPSALARPVLDVSRWELLPGDQVRYFARVVDIHPRGRTGRSAEHVLRMPTADELRRRAQGRLEDAASRLRTLQDEAERAAEETRNLERQARAPRREGEDEAGAGAGEQGSFQEQEELRQALEEQRRMGSAADSLGSELGALAENLREQGASDPELAGDIRELQQLLEELGGAELEQEMEDLLSRVDQMGRSESRETLEDLAARQEEFRERLREALDRAQRAAVEQDFRNTVRETEETAREQDALARSMEAAAGDPSEAALRAEQQEALAGDTEALQERMDQLADRLQELGEDDALRQLNRAQGAAERALSRMEDAAAQAARGQEQAGQTAQSAAGAMDEAARELQEAQQQMMSERVQAFQQALERTARDALALAREQGRAREAMERASSGEQAELRGEVAAVQQGVASLAENLTLAARMAGADDREMSRQMGEAMEALGRTMTALERSRGNRPAPRVAADEAVAALNEVAQSALGTLRAMEQAGQVAQPSPQELMEQMEQMAQQQADINNQAAQMMPMQLPREAMQQMMEQMAQEQQQIASDLGQMSNQEGEDGPLGDMEAMAREAEELARELRGGRLDSPTRERQERLFHRLLDAGRSLEKEEETTERESTAAGDVEALPTPALELRDLGLSLHRLPDAATLNRLPPAARALVLRYFQRLNRSGGGS